MQDGPSAEQDGEAIPENGKRTARVGARNVLCARGRDRALWLKGLG